MLKGFYTLTSGILTQSKRLNTISNNMTNASTPGFKKDTLVSSDFREELLYRTGTIQKRNPTPLGDTSMIVTADESVTNYKQGGLDSTGQTFHMALLDNGFFEIQTPQGNLYTRNGSFTLDDEGYLVLQHMGRVLGENGPIKLDTDKVTVDNRGVIYSTDVEEGEEPLELARVRIVDFNDYDQLIKFSEGMFQNNDPQNLVANTTTEIMPKTLERSNVEAMDEMVAMMTSQRSLQSAAQVLKMYDQIMAKAVTEIGKL